MKRHIFVLGLLIIGAESASAQPGSGPSLPPPVSPYLNLLRPGNSPGFNYYGMVRPQLQTLNDINGLQQQVNTNRTAISDLNGVLVPTTGHTTAFMNTFGYYPLKQTANMRPGGNAGAMATHPSTTGQMPSAPSASSMPGRQ